MFKCFQPCSDLCLFWSYVDPPSCAGVICVVDPGSASNNSCGIEMIYVQGLSPYKGNILKYIAEAQYGLLGVQTENHTLLEKTEGLSDTKTLLSGLQYYDRGLYYSVVMVTFICLLSE